MKLGWEVKKLGKVFNVQSSKRVHKADWKAEGIPFYRAREVVKLAKNGFVDNELFISEELFKEFTKDKGAPKKDDIIISAVGTLGECYLVKENDKFYIKDASVLWFAKISDVYSRYIEFAFKSKIVQDQVMDKSMGATVGTLTISRAKNIKIPIPQLPEQKRIVAILDKAFAAIAKAKANAEQNLKNAKELFESYLQGVFENKGEGWEEFKLKEICTKITDGVHKKPNYLDEGIPFIKIKNLTCDSGISFDNVSYISIEDHEEFCKRTKPEKGDLLITKDGTIGIVRIIETDIEFSIFVSVALIKPKNKNISPYLKYVFESPYIQEQIKPKGAALKHLYLKDLREYLIPIPPKVEQRSIVKKLDALSAKTKKLEAIYQQKIDNLEELKKSILQKAFNGEL